jgi:carbon storage regulator
MLVLSRKLNESIVIGDNVELKIVAIEREMVKLGITAPHDVSVYRKELYQDIRKENILAALSEKKDISRVTQHIETGKDRKM